MRGRGAGVAANRLPDGHLVWIVGEFERIEPPHMLVYSWRIGLDGTSNERVTVRFVPHAEGTEVSVVHENITTDESRALHQRGWIGCLEGLAAFAPPASRERNTR